MQQTEIKIIIPGAVQAQVTQQVTGEEDPPVQEPGDTGGTGTGNDTGTTQPPTDTGSGTTAPPVITGGKLNLTDFGAKGDGSTDDGPAIQAALQYAADEGRTVIVPPLVYLISTPVKALVRKSTVTKWGLMGPGLFRSGLNNGEDIISLIANTAGTYPRNLTLSGFEIRGSAHDGRGLVLHCEGGGWSQNVVHDLVIENVGKDGLAVEGEFFESTFSAIRILDCHDGSGVVLSNVRQGVNMSSIRFDDLNVAQCKQFGVLTQGLDNPFNAPQDCRFNGGYVRQCGNNGVRFHLGGYLEGMFFENNCLDTGDCHVSCSGPFWAGQCRGDVSMSQAKCTYLFNLDSGSGNHESIIRDSVHRDNGWNGTAKLAKLAGVHYTTIYDCPGAVDGAGGGYTRYERGQKTDVPKAA